MSPPSSPFAAYHSGFSEIDRVIRLTDGFVLVPVQVVGPDLARALGDFLRMEGHPVTLIEPETDHDWENLAPSLIETKSAKGGVVILVGGRDLPEGVYKGLRLLNQRRDTIVKHLGCPLLWCGPAAFLSLTWERAPDFWSVRAVDRKLEPTQAYDEASSEPSSSRDLLESAFSQGDFASAARIASHAIDEELTQGRIEEAARVAEDALARIPEGEEASRAEVLLRLSEVESTRGHVGDALAILRGLDARDLPADLARKVTLALGLLLQDDDPEASEGYYEKALESASEAEDHEVEARAQLGLARTEALRGGSGEEALRGIQKARALAEKSDNRGDLEATALATEAQVTALLHDRRKAERLLKQAEETTSPGQRVSPQRAQALADASRDIAQGPQKKNAQLPPPPTGAPAPSGGGMGPPPPSGPPPSLWGGMGPPPGMAPPPAISGFGGPPGAPQEPQPYAFESPWPGEKAGPETQPNESPSPPSKLSSRWSSRAISLGAAAITALVVTLVYRGVVVAPPLSEAKSGVAKVALALARPSLFGAGIAAVAPPDPAAIAAAIEAQKGASDDNAWARLAVLVYAADGGVTLRGMSAQTTSATFSPDGGSLLATSERGPATLWRAETGAPVATLVSGGAIVSGSFSPDGARVLTTDDAGLVVTWDARTGERIAEFAGGPSAGPSASGGASFSPDGTKVLSVTGGAAKLWRADGSLLVALRPREGSVTAARFSPDGTKLLLANDRGSARLLPITRDGVLAAACAVVARDAPDLAARVCSP